MYQQEAKVIYSSKLSFHEKSKKQLPKDNLVQIKKETLFEDYWRNNPHVPDSEYYCHED